MKIIIDEQICTEIERLHYEVNSRKDIITSFLQMENVSATDLFKRYQEEYNETYTAYNKAKQEMVKQYEVPSDSSWNLDFATRELTY